MISSTGVWHTLIFVYPLKIGNGPEGNVYLEVVVPLSFYKKDQKSISWQVTVSKTHVNSLTTKPLSLEESTFLGSRPRVKEPPSLSSKGVYNFKVWQRGKDKLSQASPNGFSSHEYLQTQGHLCLRHPCSHLPSGHLHHRLPVWLHHRETPPFQPSQTWYFSSHRGRSKQTINFNRVPHAYC